MNDKRVNQYLILPENGQRKDTKLAVEHSEEQIAEMLKQGYVIVNHDDFNKLIGNAGGISIHAPSRERQHQNKLLLYSFKSSIFCELAQLKYSKIYFDVRKLIVSHSSLSCEPKLNFMFHITSHRIILHYFYSCQSICK